MPHKLSPKQVAKESRERVRRSREALVDAGGKRIDIRLSKEGVDRLERLQDAFECRTPRALIEMLLDVAERQVALCSAKGCVTSTPVAKKPWCNPFCQALCAPDDTGPVINLPATKVPAALDK